ncbi:hypothetical protein N7493_005786 [Penicillium malachiteum]|uniref:Uncharacterized protein n=1 Tax=Penicillium malachiteum TaxID=1324776 RepID=A0AAD6HP60_9EURO|nr:hypothetical protein N7493_005786 [Penicillium malachiteum]
MPILDHLHWENLYYPSSPRPSQQQQAHASGHETQSLPLMPVPMAPMQHGTLNNLYYLPTTRPTLHTEHKYYPATRLEDENASFPLDPTIQSGHVDQMGILQELFDPIFMAGASLDHASQSTYPSDQGARAPYNTLKETTMNESKSLLSASGSQAAQEVQSYPNITQYVTLMLTLN